MSNGIRTACAVAVIALVGSGAANAADKIKIGFFATLEGPIPLSARRASAASTSP